MTTAGDAKARRPGANVQDDPWDPLLGRDPELTTLRSLLSDVQHGRGRLAVLHGEAGIGKTHLLREARSAAESRGFATFWASAQELERHRPFGAIADCLELSSRVPDDRRRRIGELLSGGAPQELSPLFSGSAEFDVVERIVGFVEDLCGKGPIALFVDDVQWADPSSLLVLSRLARGVADLQAFVGLACRPIPAGSDDASIHRAIAARATRFELAPLDEGTVAQLTAKLVGGPPGPGLIRHVAGAAGNPLFVTEMVEALRTAGSLRRDAYGIVDVVSPHVSPTLAGSILARLSFVPTETLDLLRIAAVLGSTIDVRVLSQLVGRPTGAMVPVLEAARETGLVREHGERLAFRHDLVREALYTSLPIAVRAELHLDAARSLAAAGIDPSKMADHLMRGARPGDPQAVASLRKAGIHAAARSPAVAVPLLRRALELTDEDDPDREEIGAELAVSLMWSGRVVEVEALCRAAAERDFGPPAEMTFRVCLVQALVAQGRSEEALEALGVASTSPTLSGPNRSRLLAWASYAAWTAGDLEAADDAATLAIATAEEAADDFAWCVATACRAAVANRRGWFHEALHILQPALDRADRSPGRVVHRFQLNNYLGAGLIDLDRLDEAKQALHRGRTLAESLGSAWTIPPYHWIAAFASFWAGGWDDAIAELETAARLAADVGTATVLAAAHALRSIIALQRGDAATAEASTSAGERELERAGRQFQMEWVGWSRALVLDASGHHAGACAVLSRTWDDCVARGMMCQYAVLGPDLVRLALETGDHPRAGSVASRVEEAATRAGTPTVAGAALRCTGLIQRHPETLLRAVDTFRQAGRPFLMALTLEEAGSALVSAGREQEAQAVLQDALRVLEQLGASSPAARVNARLRALGVRRGSRAARGRPTVGWEALTPTELRIVGLIAHGLSNPEIAEQLFLSRRTVQTHVSHALAKLGFRSRVELATEATRRGGA